MENVKIFVDGIEKNVFGLFYVFDSKYYFIYTEKEVDENDYVFLYMSLVGKETVQTEVGTVETGAMIGVEITNPEDQQKAQTSISYIVEDKKNNTVNPQIQYLPMNMISQLKIISKKRFRLLKSIIVENFKVPLGDVVNEKNESNNQVIGMVPVVPVEPIENPINVQPQPLQNLTNSEETLQLNVSEDKNISSSEGNVIIDYRSKYFEEEEKNKELQAQIDQLTQKLNEIKKVIE